MSIIARRIPYGLGNYHTSTVRAHTVRGGMNGELISRPIEPAFAGIAEALGWEIAFDPAMAAQLASTAANLYTQKKAADAAAKAAKAAADAAAKAAAAAGAAAGGTATGAGGIPTTYLLIGGAVLAGVLVFAMRRK